MSGPAACDSCLERAALIARLSGAIERCLTRGRGGRARELLALSDDELRAAIDSVGAEPPEGPDPDCDPPALRQALERTGVWALCRHDPLYPDQLRDLGDAPRALFARGEPSLLEALGAEPSVTVVGSRRPSGYGREIATSLGRELAQAGLIVVSGMALGIDSCAHEGALSAAGRTVAVLGGGPDQPHPARMRRLYERIVAAGLVLSELPPGTQPRRWTFPARNRIMAALSQMSVVVEARERSGSLITSEIAHDLGRDVGAVPGQVGARSAEGTNGLLRDGAHVVRDCRDVLDSLLGAGAPGAPARPAPPPLPPELQGILDAVEAGAAGADEVAAACGVDVGQALGALARLELDGLVAADATGRYRTRAGHRRA